MTGTLYPGLNAGDGGYYTFVATSTVHTISVANTKVYWSLYTASDFFSSILRHCWEVGNDDSVDCTLSGLETGQSYYLHVFYPYSEVIDPTYSVLIE